MQNGESKVTIGAAEYAFCPDAAVARELFGGMLAAANELQLAWPAQPEETVDGSNFAYD